MQLSPHDEDLELRFGDHRHFTSLLGQHDEHIKTLERTLGVRIDVNGTTLRVAGDDVHRTGAERFLGRVPVSLKIRGLTEKYLLREAARPHITDTVYRRQKHPFY